MPKLANFSKDLYEIFLNDYIGVHKTFSVEQTLLGINFFDSPNPYDAVSIIRIMLVVVVIGVIKPFHTPPKVPYLTLRYLTLP